MVIRASSAAEINTLIADLGCPSRIERDAAIARLTVIGARAVEQLCNAAASARADTRIAALRALAGIGDPRAFQTAIAALATPETAPAAVGVLRSLLRGGKETQAIEALTAIAVGERQPAQLRIAAAGALTELGPTVVKPLARQLEQDGDPDVRRWAWSLKSRRANRSGDEIDTAGLEKWLDGGLPDDPAAVRQAIAREGTQAPLALLARLVKAIRGREDAAPARRRAEWAVVRGTAHVVLAERDSRVALYDLRDSLAAAEGPLPVEFLAAVTKIGDASCLEPLAAAYEKSTASQERWWREHLRHAFHTIVQRDRISRRHAAMKKVLARWPAILGPTGGPGRSGGSGEAA